MKGNMIRVGKEEGMGGGKWNKERPREEEAAYTMGGN